MTSSPTSRRRFLQISAAALSCASLGLPAAAAARADGVPLWRWRGIALGAAAEIRLHHPDGAVAKRLFARMEAEISRLEAIFSLYRSDSALARLNRDGGLQEPPFELVELLSLCRRLHETTEGAFDPSIQPLWAAYARGYAASSAGPDVQAIEAAQTRVGFDTIAFDPASVRLGRPGMALSLNGIAQGYITDAVTSLLRAEGMADILVNLGEIRARGSDNEETPGWEVTLDPCHDGNGERVAVLDQAVASSAVRGTTFDEAEMVGHILDPRTGRPADTGYRGASAIAPTCALADGLSTAALVMPARDLKAIRSAFPGTAIRVVSEAGKAIWL